LPFRVGGGGAVGCRRSGVVECVTVVVLVVDVVDGWSVGDSSAPDDALQSSSSPAHNWSTLDDAVFDD